MFFRALIASTLVVGLGACVDSIPKSQLHEGVENRGDIWLSAANKAQGGAASQYDLLISAPSDKDQLIICEADNPEKCNPNSKQYHRVTKLEGVNHTRSLFLLRNFTISANMLLAIKAWKTNDKVAFGRVIEVLAEGPAATSSTGPTTGATKTYNEIATILNTHCVGCHRAGGQRSTSPMSSYEIMFPNNQQRPYVANIAKAVKGTLANVRKMPLNGTLQPTEIEALEAWERGGFKR